MSKVIKTVASVVVALGVLVVTGNPALALAAFSVTNAVTGNKPGAKTVPATPTTFRQAITSTQIIYGKARTGGLICFYHAKKSGKLDYRYFVIAIAGHEIQGVTTFYLNDEAVSVNGAGKVTSGKYADHAWLWTETGSAGATANSTFVAETGGRWTADHRGIGVAKIYAKFELTDAIIAESFPNITAEVEGKNDIMDPRTGFRGYTDNAILCFYDWMRTPRLDGGFGIQADEADDDFIASQANICDEIVPLSLGGIERRYTCNGVVTNGGAPDDTRDTLLTSFAGEFTYSGGLFKAYAAAWRPPSASLLEADLVAGLNVAPLASGDSIANEVRGTFNDPSQMYQPQEYPALSLPTDDDLYTLNIDLPFTKSVAMCQRITKIYLLRANAERSVTWPMNMKGIAVEALDTVQLATPRFGLSNYSWKVMGWSMGADFAVTLQLREESPDFYDWVPAVDQQIPLPPAEPITTPPVIEVGNGGGVDTLAALTDGPTQITVTFVLPDTASVVGYEIYRGTSTVFSAASLIASDFASPEMIVSEPVTGLTPDTTYRFWARARLGTGAFSPLSGPVTETTEI